MLADKNLQSRRLQYNHPLMTSSRDFECNNKEQDPDHHNDDNHAGVDSVHVVNLHEGPTRTSSIDLQRAEEESSHKPSRYKGTVLGTS